MRVFTLNSHVHIIVWSLALGFILNWLGYIFYQSPGPVYPELLCNGPELCIGVFKRGFPIHAEFMDFVSFIINLVFWILLSFFVLRFVRYFRNRQPT